MSTYSYVVRPVCMYIYIYIYIDLCFRVMLIAIRSNLYLHGAFIQRQGSIFTVKSFSTPEIFYINFVTLVVVYLLDAHCPFLLSVSKCDSQKYNGTHANLFYSVRIFIKIWGRPYVAYT
jgi:hypothetical protein